MNFQADTYRNLYEKCYREALAANYAQNFALAQQKFIESAKALRRLAAVDLANSEVYKKRAEQMERIAAALEPRIVAQEPPAAPTPAQAPQQAPRPSRGASAPAARGSGTSAGTQAAPDEDMSAYYTFYTAGELTDGFDKVIGLEEAKEAVTEYVINPIRYPDAYSYNFLSSKCILLEGPPGTGKTTFAKAVAKEIEQPFVLVNVAAMVNCYVGETGKTIDKVFTSLRNYVEQNDCGITVFFDEFDEIAKSRGGDDKASQTAVPALLRNLDGVKENKNFLILANTNCKESLDSGVLSRFRRKIYIPLPDLNMRIQFFRSKLRQLEPLYFNALNFEELAAAADGMSGRTIAQVCDDFLHFVGGVKAGLRACSDFNQALLEIILKQK